MALVSVTCYCGNVFEYEHVRGRLRKTCTRACRTKKVSKPARPTEAECSKCHNRFPVKKSGKIPDRCPPCRAYEPKGQPRNVIVVCSRCENEFKTIAYNNGRLPKYCDACRETIRCEKQEARKKETLYRSTPPEVLAKERIDQLETLFRPHN